MATTNQLVALSNDGAFRLRCRTLVLQICAEVYGEDPATANHNQRASFVHQILSNVSLTDQITVILVTRTNLVASNVSFNFDTGHVETDASDAAIKSQLSTDWNMLAGI